MTDYSYYHPLPYADGCRLSHLQAQQYALERICGLLRDDIMRAAFTDGEQSTLQTLLRTAQQRAAAGLVEFDGYKRREPVACEAGEAGL
jgi:hypothetical protein